jgi:hypothetical protein
MTDNNTQFENYLREFQPRRPRALPILRAYWTNRLAAAAALLLATSASLYLATRQPIAKPNVSVAIRNARPSLVVLTRLATDDPAQLDSLLNSQAQSQFPRLQQENSSLRVLAKE